MKLLRISCALLVFCVLIVEPAEKAKAETPALYTWQIERMQDGQPAWVITGMESLDIAYAYQDIPAMYFPMQLVNTQYMVNLPDGGIEDGVWAVP